MKTDIISELFKRIASDCKPVDREERFNDMLDECYSFDSVGGPFANMSPSQVLLECDPIAHRCGVNDYADSESWVEVEGETYEQDDAEKVKTELTDELESSLSDLESEIEEMESDETADQAELEDKNSQAAGLRVNISEIEDYSF